MQAGMMSGGIHRRIRADRRARRGCVRGARPKFTANAACAVAGAASRLTAASRRTRRESLRRPTPWRFRMPPVGRVAFENVRHFTIRLAAR